MSTAWSEPDPVLKSTSNDDSISRSAREGEHRARSSTVDNSPSVDVYVLCGVYVDVYVLCGV